MKKEYTYSSKYWVVQISYEDNWNLPKNFEIPWTYIDIELSDIWNKRKWTFEYIFPVWEKSEILEIYFERNWLISNQ